MHILALEEGPLIDHGTIETTKRATKLRTNNYQKLKQNHNDTQEHP
jgi:hypothetical protein